MFSSAVTHPVFIRLFTVAYEAKLCCAICDAQMFHRGVNRGAVINVERAASADGCCLSLMLFPVKQEVHYFSNSSVVHYGCLAMSYDRNRYLSQ